MQPKYIQLLNERIAKGSERSLLSFDTALVDFWSNDYLGLGKNDSTVKMHSGSGSRLISGNSKKIEEVESFLASHFGSESALIFNSGYDANLGFFSSVPQKGDTIIYDELIHASVRDGMRLSFAKSFSFEHNNLESLEKRLKSADRMSPIASAMAQGTVFVAVESIYSMDGDLAPLKAIANLCQLYNALLVVDEAHAGAVFGNEGRGLCDELGIVDKVFARLVTFGKGFGAHGGAILGSNQLRTFLINFSRSFIYTTALPEAFYQHIQLQVELAKNNELREKLQENISIFRKEVKSKVSDATSPIQVIDFNELEICKQKAAELQQAGFAVKAILPPTVSIGIQRLRICIHAFNTPEEIKKLVTLLK